MEDYTVKTLYPVSGELDNEVLHDDIFSELNIAPYVVGCNYSVFNLEDSPDMTSRDPSVLLYR